MDAIHLSLTLVMANVQVLGECGPERWREPGEPTPAASLFVVMQVVQDELERVQEVMGGLRKKN